MNPNETLEADLKERLERAVKWANDDSISVEQFQKLVEETEVLSAEYIKSLDVLVECEECLGMFPSKKGKPVEHTSDHDLDESAWGELR